MADKHAGPSKYRPDNQASAPAKPRSGPVEQENQGKSLGHPHEKKDAGSPLGKGFGKIKSTGKPRFTRF
jgi:hypothetical protein